MNLNTSLSVIRNPTSVTSQQTDQTQADRITDGDQDGRLVSPEEVLIVLIVMMIWMSSCILFYKRYKIKE